MLENDNQGFSQETTNVPEGVTSEAQSTTAEFDVDRSDNIGQLREHVKGLKSDLDTYKSTHNFVQENFGDLENAKLAQQLYSGIVSEEFNPEEFYNILRDVSPNRAQSLIDAFAQEQAANFAYDKVTEFFGGEVTPEEVALFKQWRDSGYMITNEEDIPEAFKFDAYGNPLSEEQVNTFREQFKMLNNLKSQIENQVTSAQQREIEEQQSRAEAEQNERIASFELNSLKVLENDLQAVGLNMMETDSPEVRQQKEFVREFIIGGVGRMFLQNPQLAKDYSTALDHIRNGEERLARRYEPRIQKGLLDIVRSEPISRLLSSLAPQAPKQARPEISNSGVSAPTGQPAGSREERIRQLVSSGALKL